VLLGNLIAKKDCVQQTTGVEQMIKAGGSKRKKITTVFKYGERILDELYVLEGVAYLIKKVVAAEGFVPGEDKELGFHAALVVMLGRLEPLVVGYKTCLKQAQLEGHHYIFGMISELQSLIRLSQTHVESTNSPLATSVGQLVYAATKEARLQLELIFHSENAKAA
jgi:hypothetical protein